MASTYFTRSALLNIAKANIPRFASLSFPQKASRVCFTSASKHSQGKHASQESNSGYKGDEAESYSDINAKHKMEQGKDGMKEGAHEMKDSSMDSMKDTNEKVKHKATEMKDKTKDVASNAADRAGEMKDNVKHKPNDMAGRAADRAGDMKETGHEVKRSAEETAAMAADKAEDGRSKAADMAKAAKDKTMSAAEAVVDKTKETVAGAWDAAEGTGKKIKETVAGTSDDEDDWCEDRAEKHKKIADERAEDLRRKVGNLDHEKKDY